MTANNPVLETIKNRRSIRKYTDEPIAPEVLHQILEAGFNAPSAMNRRPFHVVVLDDHSIMDQIPAVQKYTRMITGAPCALLVCGDYSISGDFYMEDCGAMTQNLLLAATSLGIGSCWCGIEHVHEAQAALSKLLELPDHIHPYALVILGHPAEERPAPQRFDESRIHHNRW